MSAKRRRTIARGIYEDRFGFTIRWREGGIPIEKRFALDTPLERLKQYRAEQLRQVADVRRSEQTGSFARDVVRFLRLRTGRPSFKSDRAHLRPWARRFKKLSRWHIKREHVEQAMAWWRAEGYSARELRHRLRILQQLFYTLDGSSARTPCDDVKAPPIPKARPVSVSDQVVRDVAVELWKAEQRSYLRDSKTRARYLVLATTGQRPAQVKRAIRGDVDLERRLWFVRTAKNALGPTLYLNDEMIAAWQLFIAAQAWGLYDSRSFAKVLRRNGWPKGIRPYNLRHSVGMGLSERDVDLGDIQSHMGHVSPTTTRIYVPGVAKRARAASAKLEGRFGPSFGLSRFTFTREAEQKANKGHNRPLSGSVQDQKVGRRRLNKRKKSA